MKKLLMFILFLLYINLLFSQQLNPPSFINDRAIFNGTKLKVSTVDSNKIIFSDFKETYIEIIRKEFGIYRHSIDLKIGGYLNGIYETKTTYFTDDYENHKIEYSLRKEYSYGGNDEIRIKIYYDGIFYEVEKIEVIYNDSGKLILLSITNFSKAIHKE